MLDDPPDIGPDGKWPDDWSPEERVEAIADMLHQPRDADWVADEADVSPNSLARCSPSWQSQMTHLFASMRDTAGTNENYAS